MCVPRECTQPSLEPSTRFRWLPVPNSLWQLQLSPFLVFLFHLWLRLLSTPTTQKRASPWPLPLQVRTPPTLAVCYGLFSHRLWLCCLAVGSVHSGPSIQAIQAASLPAVAPQPSFVSTSFPAEDEQHSQPISQQGFHYLHSAYRVGEVSHLAVMTYL